MTANKYFVLFVDMIVVCGKTCRNLFAWYRWADPRLHLWNLHPILLIKDVTRALPIQYLVLHMWVFYPSFYKYCLQCNAMADIAASLLNMSQTAIIKQE